MTRKEGYYWVKYQKPPFDDWEIAEYKNRVWFITKSSQVYFDDSAFHKIGHYIERPDKSPTKNSQTHIPVLAALEEME